MKTFLWIVTFTILTASLTFGDRGVQSDENKKSIKFEENVKSPKAKRGIRYAYSPRFRAPYSLGYFKNPFSPTYAITPGNAVVHSYNVNYPKVYTQRLLSRPAFLPPPAPAALLPKPIVPVPSVPFYANRYPIFVQKPFGIPKPIVPVPSITQFTMPNLFSNIPPHIHATNPLQIPLPVPNSFVNVVQPLPLFSQNGWKPVHSPISGVQSVPINSPTVTILPPIGSLNVATSSLTHRPNNYYLPPDPSAIKDVTTHSFSDEFSHNGRRMNILLFHICLTVKKVMPSFCDRP